MPPDPGGDDGRLFVFGDQSGRTSAPIRQKATWTSGLPCFGVPPSLASREDDAGRWWNKSFASSLDHCLR